MQTYVALLYSIILGEGRRVVMADLKAMAETSALVDRSRRPATRALLARAAKWQGLERVSFTGAGNLPLPEAFDADRGA